MGHGAPYLTLGHITIRTLGHITIRTLGHITIRTLARHHHRHHAHQAARVGAPHHRGLGHGGMLQHHGLHLHGAHEHRVHLEQVVGAPHVPVHPVVLHQHVAHAHPLAVQQLAGQVCAPPVAGGVARGADPQAPWRSGGYRGPVLIAQRYLGAGHGAPEAPGQVLALPGGQDDVRRLGAPEPLQYVEARQHLGQPLQHRPGQGVAGRHAQPQPLQRAVLVGVAGEEGGELRPEGRYP